MTNIIEKTNDQPYYSMQPVRNLFTLRFNFLEPLFQSDQHGAAVCTGYEWRSHHVKNLSKDYGTAIKKAHAYVGDEKLQICEKKDLLDYSTATTGIKGGRIRDHKEWLEAIGYDFDAVSAKYAYLHQTCNETHFQTLNRLQTIIWPEWETQWNYLRPRNTADWDIVKHPKISDKDADLLANCMATRSSFHWAAFFSIYHQMFIGGKKTSEKQREYMASMLKDLCGSDVADQKRSAYYTKIMDARAEQSKLSPVPNTDKRISIRGVIESVKSVDTDFGYVLKCVIKTVDGYKVYGTVPAALLRLLEEENLVGTECIFSAAIHRSDDEFFGFYKRPTQVMKVGTLEPSPLAK